MSRKLDAALIDADNPNWTPEEAVGAKTFSGLPKTLQAKLARRVRGTQIAPTKERVTIRLSPTVVESFRATGAGWQTRIDVALQEWLNSHSL